MRARRSKRNKYIKKTLYIIGFALFVIVTVFPFYWQLLTSVKDPADIGKIPTQLWPERFSLKLFESVFVNHHLQTYLLNSIIVATGAMVLTIIIAFPAAYAFSRIDFTM